MGSIRRAVVFSLAQRYGQILLALGSNMALARLLSPEEIGIYSVSVAVIGIAQVLRDFGIGSFLIQEERLQDSHISTAFGLSLIVGASLFLAVALGAPMIASFYSEPRLVDTLRISSLNFLILPFCTISLALLSRELQFDRIAAVSLASTVAGVFVTLGAAYLDQGPRSMAIGGTVTNVFMGLGAWLARGRQPLLRPSLSQWRALLGFGGQSAVTGIVTSVSMDINDLVTSRLLGFAPVAQLSRAQGVMNLFHRDVMGALRSVAYPAFAKARRDREALEPQYAQAVTGVTALAWPFYGFAALFSVELVNLLFGTQWDKAASLVPWFCAAGAIASLSSLAYNLITAAGRVDLVTRAELVFQPLRAATIVSAVWWHGSLVAAAIAYLATAVLYTPLAYWVKQRCEPTDWPALLRGLKKSLLVAGLTLLGPTLVAGAGEFNRTLPIGAPAFLLAVALGSASWIAAIRIVRHPIGDDPAFLAIWNRLARLKKR